MRLLNKEAALPSELRPRGKAGDHKYLDILEDLGVEYYLVHGSEKLGDIAIIEWGKYPEDVRQKAIQRIKERRVHA